MPDIDVIRLVSFNILHGASPRDGIVDLDRFAAAIRALRPDILALQEVDHGQLRSGGVELTAVAAAAMGATVSCFLPVIPGRLAGAQQSPVRPAGSAAGPTAEPDRIGYGISLLSRFPGTDWRGLRLPRLRHRYPVWRGAEHRLVRIRDEARGALLARFTTPSGPLTVANAHLSYVPGIREVQLRRLVRRLRVIEDPLVLMGDLNLRAPWPARLSGYHELARHLTIPADRPRLQIDHVLTRGRVRAVHSEAVDAGLSDHRALVVDVSLTAHSTRS